MSLQYNDIQDACSKGYLPEEEGDYTKTSSDVDWDDEYEQTYCEEENNFEIIEEIDLFGNKIKKKVIRNNAN